MRTGATATAVDRTSPRAQAIQALARSSKLSAAAVRRLSGRAPCGDGAALSHAQYLVLFELLGGDLSAGALATTADVSPASMTQMLDRLAHAGLLERTRSERDRRIVTAHLTDAGRAACEARREEIAPLWQDMLADLTIEQMQTATVVLERLTEIYDRMGDGARGV